MHTTERFQEVCDGLSWIRQQRVVLILGLDVKAGSLEDAGFAQKAMDWSKQVKAFLAEKTPGMIFENCGEDFVNHSASWIFKFMTDECQAAWLV